MKKAIMAFVWVYVVALIVFFGYKTYEVVKGHYEPAPVVEQQEVVEGAATEEKEVVHYEVEVVFEECNPVTLEAVQAELVEQTEETKIRLGEFKLTAYCSCATCCEEYALNRPIDENGNEIVYTASGSKAVQGVTVAVDPAVIPYGAELEIMGNKYIAHDCGGDIKEKRIDVYFENHQDAWNFGTQYAEVFLCQ
jgi:3D (Asp-Asp-Asp) domain-containing protein